jgi:hypothetical protein
MLFYQGLMNLPWSNKDGVWLRNLSARKQLARSGNRDFLEREMSKESLISKKDFCRFRTSGVARITLQLRIRELVAYRSSGFLILTHVAVGRIEESVAYRNLGFLILTHIAVKNRKCDVRQNKDALTCDV